MASSAFKRLMGRRLGIGCAGSALMLAWVYAQAMPVSSADLGGEDGASAESEHVSAAGGADEQEPRVLVVSLQGDLAQRHRQILANGLLRADRGEVDTLVVEVDSTGGDLDIALELMRKLHERDEPPLLYVSGDAAGPAALLALASPRVLVHPSAVVGPVILGGDENGDGGAMDSFRKKKIIALLPDVPGRRELARAMIDPDRAFTHAGVLLSEPGTRLSLLAEEALLSAEGEDTPLLARGTANTLEDAVTGLSGMQRARYTLVEWDRATGTIQARQISPEAPRATAAGARPATVSRDATPDAVTGSGEGGKVRVYVVPIKDGIGSPQLFILRRALKQAIEEDVDAIVLDMDTPGGALNTTLDMMEALQRFDGHTLTYVNSDAISAGSYISIATEDIYMAPTGVIGAAAVVSGSGQEIPATMKAKVNSVLDGIIRTYTDEYPFRARVQRAMMDPSADFTINGEPVLSSEGKPLAPPGTLLTLTAEEATREYIPEDIERFGPEPRPLLAAGIADDLEDVLTQRFGADNFEMTVFEITWSEEISKWLVAVAPLLLGGGLLLLYMEAQSPGFGIFGIAGLLLLALFFSSNYVAGLAGYEDVILFLVGVLLIALEIFFFPGTIVLGASGAVLVLGSLLWAMSDNWPTEGIEVSPDLLLWPAIQLILGLAIAIGGAFALARVLPKRGFWDKIILRDRLQPAGAPPLSDTGVEPEDTARTDGSRWPGPGSAGHAVTTLFPSGEVSIEGRRYQAKVTTGMINKGQRVVVRDRRDFVLLVAPAEE